MAGQRFGRLVALSYAGSDRNGRATWLCRCDCGVEKVLLGGRLRGSVTTSCGCIARAEDISGRRYGRLTVLNRAGRRGKGATWLCLCDCGRETVALGCGLRRGGTVSCGCLRVTHGMSDHPAYRSWHGAIQRCTNPRLANWPNYGGRGIKICDRWRNSFEAFWGDNPGWQPGMITSRATSVGRPTSNKGGTSAATAR
jgi:hypothetical protein